MRYLFTIKVDPALAKRSADDLRDEVSDVLHDAGERLRLDDENRLTTDGESYSFSGMTTGTLTDPNRPAPKRITVELQPDGTYTILVDGERIPDGNLFSDPRGATQRVIRLGNEADAEAEEYDRLARVARARALAIRESTFPLVRGLYSLAQQEEAAKATAPEDKL